MFSINVEGGAPIYEQLYKRISQLIVNGTLAEDEKLPTVRVVAKELGINPNTVQKTYHQLEADGLIYSIPAKGSYVSRHGNAITAIKEIAAAEFRKAVQNAKAQGLSTEELADIINGGKND